MRAGKEEPALRTGQFSEPLVNVAAVAGENGPLGEPARALVAGVRPRLLVLELYVIAQVARHLNVQSCVDAAPVRWIRIRSYVIVLVDQDPNLQT